MLSNASLPPLFRSPVWFPGGFPGPCGRSRQSEVGCKSLQWDLAFCPRAPGEVVVRSCCEQAWECHHLFQNSVLAGRYHLPARCHTHTPAAPRAGQGTVWCGMTQTEGLSWGPRRHKPSSSLDTVSPSPSISQPEIERLPKGVPQSPSSPTLRVGCPPT